MKAFQERLWDIGPTAEFVRINGYKRVALQFPDDMLCHSTAVAGALERELRAGYTVAVLADTAFNPEAVDEVAARHMNADCVVHYGRASLAAVSELPVLFVFPHTPVHVPSTALAIAQAVGHPTPAAAADQQQPCVVVIPDQGILHASEQLQQQLMARMHKGWTLVMARPAVASSRSPQQQKHQGQGGASIGTVSGGGELGVLGHTTLSLGTATSSSIGQGGGSSTAAAGTTTSVAGYSYSLPAGVEEAQCLFVWVGPSDVPALQALQLSLNTAQWLRCEPADWEPSAESATASTAGPGPEPTAASTGKEAQAESAHAPAESEGAAGSTAGAPKSPVCKVEEGLAPGTQALLKRRYFLVEKAKEASIVGILVGTLAVAGLQEAMAALRRLVAEADKKSYTMLMGKPNPAKLANFPEVDVWVQLADPLGFILDSKPYLAPIITPYEAVLAMTYESLLPGQPYRLGLDVLLEQYRQYNDPALGGAGKRTKARAWAGEGAAGAAGSDQEEEDGEGDDGTALVAFGRMGLGVGAITAVGTSGSKQVIKARDAAEYLAVHRTFKGCEAPVAGAEFKAPAAAVEGLSGRAATYVSEPAKDA